VVAPPWMVRPELVGSSLLRDGARIHLLTVGSTGLALDEEMHPVLDAGEQWCVLERDFGRCKHHGPYRAN